MNEFISNTYDDLKEHLFQLSDSLVVEKQKESKDFDVIISLRQQIRIEMDYLVAKLTQISGQLRTDTLTGDEANRISESLRLDTQLYDEIYGEEGDTFMPDSPSTLSFVSVSSVVAPCIPLSEIRYDVYNANSVCNSSNFVRIFSFTESICDMSSIYMDSDCSRKALSGYYSQSDFTYRYWNGHYWVGDCNHCIF